MKTTDLVRKLLPSLYEQEEYKYFFTQVVGLLSGDVTIAGWINTFPEFFLLITKIFSDDDTIRRTALYELSTYMRKFTLSDRPLQQLYHFNRATTFNSATYEVTKPIQDVGWILKFNIVECYPDPSATNTYYVFGMPNDFFLAESPVITYTNDAGTTSTANIIGIHNGIITTDKALPLPASKFSKVHIQRHVIKHAVSVSTYGSLTHGTYADYLTKVKFTPDFTEAQGNSIPYRTIHHYEGRIPYSTVSFTS